MDDACHKHPGPDFVENIQTGSMLFNTKYIYKQKTGVQKGLAPWAPEKGAVAENHEMVREKNYADLHIGQVPLVKSYMEGVIVQISICSGNTTYSYVSIERQFYNGNNSRNAYGYDLVAQAASWSISWAVH